MSDKWVNPRPDENPEWMEAGHAGLDAEVFERGSGRGGYFQPLKGSQTRSKNRKALRMAAKLSKTPKPRHAGGFN